MTRAAIGVTGTIDDDAIRQQIAVSLATLCEYALGCDDDEC